MAATKKARRVQLRREIDALLDEQWRHEDKARAAHQRGDSAEGEMQEDAARHIQETIDERQAELCDIAPAWAGACH